MNYASDIYFVRALTMEAHSHVNCIGSMFYSNCRRRGKGRTESRGEGTEKAVEAAGLSLNLVRSFRMILSVLLRHMLYSAT